MRTNTPSLPWALDAANDGASDALLDDLLTFLDDDLPLAAAPSALADDATSLDSHSDGASSVASPTPFVSVEDAPPPLASLLLPAKRKRPSKAKQGCPIKRTLDALRDEAEQLTQTLHRLRADATRSSTGSATEAALTERFKRRRAERECEQLRDAVYAQAQFLRGLQSVFSAPPSFASGLNLCRHLHTYTRLPRSRSVRWSEYAALSQETRLQRAMDILCRETQALTCNERGFGGEPARRLLSSTVDAPFVNIEVLNQADGFGVTSTSVYALETRDIGAVVRGACVAVRDILVRCSSYQCTRHRGQIVDQEAAAVSPANMLYRVTDVHHKSLQEDSDELTIESRVVTLYKQTEDHAIVLWDYIDDDELHPTTEKTDITRQAVGACLIRREICDDGVERTVCRLLNTRRYHFHHDASTEKLRRFQRSSLATNRENELLFRNILMDSITKEEAAYARVVGTMGARM